MSSRCIGRTSRDWPVPLFRIVAEIYQLLFHFASLGVHTIRAAQVKEADNASTRTWEGWGRAERRAADALALGMMLPNLFLAGLLSILAISALPFVSRVPPAVVGVGALVFIGLVIAWIVSVYDAYRPGAKRWAVSMGVPIVLVFSGVCSGPLVRRPSRCCNEPCSAPVK